MKRISLFAAMVASLLCMGRTVCLADDGIEPVMIEPAGMELTACDAYGCDSLPCGCCTPEHYLSVFGGWNFLHSYDTFALQNGATAWGSFNDGWAIGGALGRRICEPLRLEVEYAFRDNTADFWRAAAMGPWSGRTQLHTLMANSQFDLPSICGVRPYVGAGLGLAYAEGRLTTGNGLTTIRLDDEAFAYQFMAGVSRCVTCNIDVFAEYRFLESLSVKTRTTNALFIEEEFGHFENESVLFGLRMYY